MATSKLEILTTNINSIIEFSGITDEDFANVMCFSLRKLKYIRKGNRDLSIKELEILAGFSQFTIYELTSKILKLDKNYRVQLLKASKNKDYKVILEKVPSLTFAIKLYLLEESFFKQNVEVKEIRAHLQTLNWNYASSAISTALGRMSELIEIRKHETKKNINVYARKSQ